MADRGRYRPDGRWRDVLIEVKRDTHGFRDLRASLLGFAYRLSARPENRGLLLLVGSRITEKRLQEERQLAAKVVRPEVMHRLIIASGGDVKREQSLLHVAVPPIVPSLRLALRS